ncbi:uncharacterized protein LOC108046996 [Drosophila rhopaloa]|uniref:Uncharacterized protein LOC108046996 n=1 Tax=Drosophila rhopaloa TaxID=1041015 RepID=A0A6P4EWD5_DRORH|nr:uncharacterized protein LOC108046996 [Drosophila rhopaloa]
MAKAKLNLWMTQLRSMGRSLRWDFSTINNARWTLPWTQTIYKRLPSTPSSAKFTTETNEVPITEGLKCEEQCVGLNGIRDIKLGDPSIPKIDGEMARPQNGFISRALYYRRLYMKR